ncbi:MAG TPA: UPF0182 family protein [Actinomycetes bacterium]
MSFQMPRDPDEPRPGGSAAVRVPRRRNRALLITVVVLGVVVIGFWIFAGFYTDLLWFRSIGFSRVFTTELITQASLFIVFGALMAFGVGFNVWLAYRVRPAFRGLSPEQQNLDRYRVALDPFRRVILIGGSLLLGFLAAGSAAGEWRTWLLFRNSQPFGTKDAQFNTDLSFFAFRLPFWRFLVGFGFAVVILALIAAAVTHYVYGGLRLQTPGEKTTVAARNHIAVLLGVFVLLKAIAYHLDRYSLVVKDSARISGATYTDINAVLPAKSILFWIALVCAVLFFATVLLRNWMAPGIGFGLLVLSAVIIGGIYPAIVQQFQVKPSEPDKEAPYIARNIEATRSAYDLADVKETEYKAAETAKPGALAASQATVKNIRLMDPAVVSPTFKALQQIRGFYDFADSLDVDRYQLGAQDQTPGTPRDAVVAVRELDLNGLNAGQRNWANDHAVYTHGYGIVAAYGNTAAADGSPDFFESDIPPQGLLSVAQPRIYFGERSPEYSIVGAPAGANPRELDYPDDKSANGQANYTYTGKGGVPVGSTFNRLLYAVRFQEGNILLSDLINKDSKILYVRDPRTRVEKVAPWLAIDGDPYPAVVGGKIVWILDGYTTTNGYPYSQRTTLGEATTDSLTTTTTAVLAQPKEQVNYIRNSVKAVVDAYDGTVTLYQWDTTDPVLKAWSKAFPGSVTPYSQIAPDLMAHFRYPEDLFKVQRELYAKYHVTDAKAFYSAQAFWQVPNDPTNRGAGTAAQPPYYLTLQMPDQTSPSFSLTTTFAPNNRQTLAAFMAVDAEPGPDYGTIRVLRLPSNTTVPGPEQVQNKFEADPTVAQSLSLLRQGGSDVVLGNLLSLPVGGGLLYVEPVYVKSTQGAAAYPLLKKVLVGFADTIGYADTLQGALDQVFSGNSGTTTTPTTPTTPSTGGHNPALDKALADAQQALKDSEAALKAGDFAAYGEAQQRLSHAIAAAVAASAASASPSPSASASPSVSVSPAAVTG